MLTDPFREEDGKLEEHLPPILNKARPFVNDIHCREIEHFEQGFIGGEDTLSFRHLTKLLAVALDDIGHISEIPRSSLFYLMSFTKIIMLQSK